MSLHHQGHGLQREPSADSGLGARSWKRLAPQGTTEPWQECWIALRPDELVPALGSLPAFAAGMP